MIYAIVALVVLILDQGVKYWTNTTLVVGEVKEFIPNILELTHHHNYGMAFGLLADKAWARWLFVALTIIFCGVIIYMLSQNILRGRAGRWLIVLAMAGGLGNCIDRVINGYVIDMFHFQFKIFGWDFPIFNIADMFITVGGIAFCFWLIFHKPTEEEKALEAAKKRGTPPPRRAVPREGAVPRDDYITQLKKPVAAAKVDLENERERAKRLAEERERERQAKAAGRPKPAPRAAAPAEADPFAEFMGSPSIMEQPEKAPPAQPAARSAPPPAPARERAPAPAPTPAPAPAPAPKKDDMEFSLEDIMAEFSDK